MHRYSIFAPISVLTLLTLTLFACAPFHPQDERAAICNELNSRMIFNSSTSNDRKSDIARSEQELIERSYQKAQCDQT